MLSTRTLLQGPRCPSHSHFAASPSVQVPKVPKTTCRHSSTAGFVVLCLGVGCPFLNSHSISRSDIFDSRSVLIQSLLSSSHITPFHFFQQNKTTPSYPFRVFHSTPRYSCIPTHETIPQRGGKQAKPGLTSTSRSSAARAHLIMLCKVYDPSKYEEPRVARGRFDARGGLPKRPFQDRRRLYFETEGDYIHV